MTKGIILLLFLWVLLVLRSLQYAWIGVVGYAGFAVLCPTWNWRWGLPEWSYQKYLAGATLLSWFMAGLSQQRLTRGGIVTLVSLVAYLALSFVSSTQSINLTKSAFYIDISWKIILMVVIGTLILREPKHLMALAWVILLGQGWNAYNVNQLYYGRGINVNWFTWNFLDNNTYSISTVPIMAIAFALMVTAGNRYARWLAGLIFVLQMHQLMFLQSRGTMLGALFLAAVAVYFMPKNRQSLTYVLGGLLAGVILAGPSVVEEFSSSFKAQGELDSSADSRYLLWKAGARIMQDYPLLGVGPWAGEMKVPQYYEGDIGGMSAKALHNLFFEVGTGSGVPALACYLLAFIIPWWQHFRLWRSDRHQFPEWMQTVNLATLCGIPGYWAASMFSSGALIESPYLLIVLATAALAVYANRLEEQELDSEDENLESVVDSDLPIPEVNCA